MQINAERLESLKATMMSDEDSITLYYKDKHNGGSIYYFITDEPKLGKWKNSTDKEDAKELGSLTSEEFLKEVKDKELEGEIFLGYHTGEEANAYISDWDEYAKKMGVSKLVALSTKVPEVIAKRFAYFADEKSAKLRQLVVEYVKKEWVEQADNLIFQSDV